VAVVLLPAVLAAEAGGQKRFELDALTVGDALRGLPVRDLLFDEAGELRRLINVYVDGVDARGGRLLEEPLRADSEVRVIGAVAGGSAAALALPPRAVAGFARDCV
jgi:molybdopterin converting factor small subunit